MTTQRRAVRLTEAQRGLLCRMSDTADGVRCDGPDRAIAHELESAGLTLWKGSTWGSQFWTITESGRAALQASDGGEK